MDPHVIWNGILTVVMGAGGWVLKTIYDALKSLERDLSAHKIEVARDYVTNEDLSRIENKLDRVLDKLERKADRE